MPIGPDDAIADAASPDAPMSERQSSRLKALAEQALELEAFDPDLTEAEAARRIAALSAKLARQDGPPHTL